MENETLIAARRRRGWSQMFLAQVTKVPVTAIMALERMDYSRPLNKEKMFRIALCLGLKSTDVVPLDVQSRLKKGTKNKALIAARKGRGWSQMDLAKVAKVPITAIAALEKRDYSKPSIEDNGLKVAICLGIGTDDVLPLDALTRSRANDISFSDLPADEAEMVGQLTQPESPSLPSGKEADLILKRVMKLLTYREKSLISLYFGINCRPMNLSEIGKKFKVTRERVRQIIIKGISRMNSKLRVIVGEKDIAGYPHGPDLSHCPYKTEVGRSFAFAKPSFGDVVNYVDRQDSEFCEDFPHGPRNGDVGKVMFVGRSLGMAFVGASFGEHFATTVKWDSGRLFRVSSANLKILKNNTHGLRKLAEARPKSVEPATRTPSPPRAKSMGKATLFKAGVGIKPHRAWTPFQSAPWKGKSKKR